MKLKHFDHDGRARFITFGTYRKIPLLTNNEYRKILIRSIDFIRSERKFRLLGYVIMPEHVHLVIVPPVESKVGTIIGEIKSRSAKAILEMMKAGSHRVLNKLTVERDGRTRFVFWQRRCYDHNCRTDEAIWKIIEYCHNNPVKRGLVSSPDRWLWSSYRWYFGESNVMLNIDASG